jgi:hypothetical protein
MSAGGQFVINFENGPTGPVKPEGQILSIQYPGAKAIFGGIWRYGENGPTIIFGKMADNASMILKRSAFSIKGPGTLKVRAYMADWTKM